MKSILLHRHTDRVLLRSTRAGFRAARGIASGGPRQVRNEFADSAVRARTTWSRPQPHCANAAKDCVHISGRRSATANPAVQESHALNHRLDEPQRILRAAVNHFLTLLADSERLHQLIGLTMRLCHPLGDLPRLRRILQFGAHRALQPPHRSVLSAMAENRPRRAPAADRHAACHRNRRNARARCGPPVASHR